MKEGFFCSTKRCESHFVDALCFPGRLAVAFDATYLTATLCQMELHSRRGLVGGCWHMDHAENAFISLEGQDPIDTSSVPKASSMLEFVGWHPGTKKKRPISLLSMPIEVNFAGSAANARGNYYMATIVGQFMNTSDGLVKVLICDNHSTHQVIRRALHGQLSEDEESIISQVPWFKDLQREDVPRHLPRFPMRIVRHAEEVVYGVPGVCSLDGFGYTYVFCSFQLVKSILLHLIGYLFFLLSGNRAQVMLLKTPVGKSRAIWGPATMVPTGQTCRRQDPMDCRRRVFHATTRCQTSSRRYWEILGFWSPIQLLISKKWYGLIWFDFLASLKSPQYLVPWCWKAKTMLCQDVAMEAMQIPWASRGALLHHLVVFWRHYQTSRYQ